MFKHVSELGYTMTGREFRLYLPMCNQDDWRPCVRVSVFTLIDGVWVFEFAYLEGGEK